MNVIYDHDIFCAQVVGGVSRYFVELATAISASGQAEVSIHAPLHVSRMLEAADPRVRAGKRLPVFPGVTRLTGLACAAKEGRLSRDAILHATWYRKRPAGFRRFAITIHDMIAEKFPHQVRGAEHQTRIKKASADAADLVFCVSECTRDDLLDRYPELEPKVVVTPLATRIGSLVVAPMRSEVPYILYVGNRHGYKNFASFAGGFAAAYGLRRAYRILCFGGEPLDQREASSYGLSLGSGEGQVTRISGDDALLEAAYRGASLVVVPSVYEGFGLPSLEALACNAPLLISGARALRETAGIDVPYVEEAGSAEAWEPALRRSLSRTQQSPVGADSARHPNPRFSWASTAYATVRAYSSVA